MDFSKMGKKMGICGKSWKLHKSFYARLKKSPYSVVVIENVPEYLLELVKAELADHDDGDHWSFDSCVLDPRIFGMGCARQVC